MKNNQIFQFTWLKLTLLALVNISLSFILIHFYKMHQSIIPLYLLSLLSFACTIFYLLMVYSFAPKNKIYIFLILFIALTPFLALPLITYLWYQKKGVGNPYFSRYKIMLLIAGSMVALTLSLTPTEFLSKNELVLVRLLPNEVSLVLLSCLESARVSALTPFDYVSTPWAAAKIKNLRQTNYPEFSTTVGMNPNMLFSVLPLGLSWVRGSPAHTIALIHFHYLKR